MSQFFDLKKNFKQLIFILAAIAIAGWYFGFNKDDVFDVAKSVATIHKPALPISVSYRKSLLGKGYVAIVENKSKDQLQLDFDLRSSAQNDPKKQAVISIEAAKKIEIGWLEGWKFELGDTISVSHKDYQTGIYKIRPLKKSS